MLESTSVLRRSQDSRTSTRVWTRSEWLSTWQWESKSKPRLQLKKKSLTRSRERKFHLFWERSSRKKLGNPMWVTCPFLHLIRLIPHTKKENLSSSRTRYFQGSTPHHPSSLVSNQLSMMLNCLIRLSDGLELERMDPKSFSRFPLTVTQTYHHLKSLMTNWRSSTIILDTTLSICFLWSIPGTLLTCALPITRRFWIIVWSTWTNHHQYLPKMLSCWTSATTGLTRTHGHSWTNFLVKSRMFQIWTCLHWSLVTSCTSNQKRSLRCTRLTPGVIVLSLAWLIACLECVWDKFVALAVWRHADPRCLMLRKPKSLSQMSSTQPTKKTQIRLGKLRQDQLSQPFRNSHRVARERKSWTHSNQMIPTGLSVLVTLQELMTS